MLHATDAFYLGNTISITAMIKEPCHVAHIARIDDIIGIEPKQVSVAHATFLVVPFPPVSFLVVNDLAYVFYNNIAL